MKNVFSTFFFLFFSFNYLAAQEICDCPSKSKIGKGTFYLTWGYNLDWFSKSDLHFKGNDFGGYDFTIEKVKAHDNPGLKNILAADLSIPQYVYRAGYFFNNKRNTGIEIAFDHAKYIMYNDQYAHLKGNIKGVNYDQDTLIGQNFLKFEHTNGANFLIANFLKRYYLAKSPSKKHWLSFVAKAGAGIVIPKTDVTLFGKRLDNKFHVAGYIVGLDGAFRYDFFSHFFVETSLKGVFANYTNVLTVGDGRAHHHFFGAEYIFSAGFQVGL
jgi:hypothetical protein